MEDRAQRVLTNPEQMTWRKSTVAHPFGTIKRWMDQGYVLTRGWEKVRAEMRLTILVDHLKSVITILGGQELIAAVGYKRSILCRYKIETTHHAMRGQEIRSRSLC